MPDVNLAPLPESVRNTLRDHDKQLADLKAELQKLRNESKGLRQDVDGAKNDIGNLAKRQGEALRLLVDLEETIGKHDKALSEPIVIDVVQNGNSSRAQRLLGTMSGVNGKPFKITIQTEK